MTEERNITPPYLSVRKIGEMVDLISSRNFPEGLTAQFFKDRGFNSADATLAVNALKFLNLLKDDGLPTPEMEIMRIKDDTRKPKLEKVIRLAYKKLYATAEDAHSLPKDKLATEFTAVYKLSDRITASALPAYYKLCEYAGLREEKANRTASKGSPKPAMVQQKKSLSSTSQNNKPASHSGFSVVPVAEGKIEIHMPESLKNKLLDDEKLIEIWFRAKSALKELADADKPAVAEASNKEEETTQ